MTDVAQIAAQATIAMMLVKYDLKDRVPVDMGI